MTNWKNFIVYYLFGSIPGIIVYITDNLSPIVKVFFICMFVDYILGFIAAVIGKSKKTITGHLSSSTGFIGILKKASMIVIVAMAIFIERTANIGIVGETVACCFIINELVSITENMGIIGIPVPNAIIKAIDILNRKEDNPDDTGRTSENS